MNADIDDSSRAEILHPEDIPKEIRRTLGNSANDRLNTLVHDIIIHSQDSPEIMMSDEVYQALMDLRKFMFQSVYTNPVAKSEEVKAKRMIAALFEFYMENYDKDQDLIPKKYITAYKVGDEKLDRVIADYISGMTDQYAVTKFNECFMPKAWEVDGY